MASKYVDYASCSLKKVEPIPGSNGLYVFQFNTGSELDLKQEYINYLMNKTGGSAKGVESSTSKLSGIIRAVFKKDQNQTYEEFVDDVKHGRVGPIGNTPIIATNRDTEHLDMNGNLLVATINSKLDDYMDCGNMLIDRDGKVIRAPQPSTIIYPCDKKTGVYPVEVYTVETNKESGRPEVTDKKFNFLLPSGKMLCSDYNFQYRTEGSDLLDVAINFYSKKPGEYVNDWGINETAYVLEHFGKPQLFTSPLEVIRENRLRIENGEDPLVSDEGPYLEAYLEGKENLDAKFEEYGRLFDAGKLSEETYHQILNILGARSDNYEKFENNEKTFEDISFEEHYYKNKQNIEDREM